MLLLLDDAQEWLYFLQSNSIQHAAAGFFLCRKLSETNELFIVLVYQFYWSCNILIYIYIITFHGSNEQHNGDESFHRTENNIAPNVMTERNGVIIIIIVGLVGK